MNTLKIFVLLAVPVLLPVLLAAAIAFGWSAP